MKNFVVATILLSTVLVGAEPPRYRSRYISEQQKVQSPQEAPYDPAGFRPQGAAFILPTEFESQRYTSPAQEYGVPAQQGEYIQPGVQQNRYTNSAQQTEENFGNFQQQRVQNQQQYYNPKQGNVAYVENQQQYNPNQGRYVQQNRYVQQQQQQQQQYNEFQEPEVQDQYSQVSNQFAQPSNQQQFKPPRGYIPPVKTTEAPAVTTTEVEDNSTTESTTVVYPVDDTNYKQGAVNGRADIENGKYTKPEDAESVGGSDEAANAEKSKEGLYYLLLPNGQLQKVIYMTAEDLQKMSYTARLQYENVEPIRGPIYAYNPMSSPFVQVQFS